VDAAVHPAQQPSPRPSSPASISSDPPPPLASAFDMTLKRTARPSTPPALGALQNSKSVADKVAALKELKNELIGHEQRKHLVLVRGVIEPLAEVLGATTPSSKATGKRRSREVNGSGGSGSSGASSWTEDDELRLQAIHIVGSLAHGMDDIYIAEDLDSEWLVLTKTPQGGRDFAEMLLTDSIILPLLASLPPNENPPRLVHAALQSLLRIAKSLVVEEDFTPPGVECKRNTALVDQLYAKPVLETWAEILDQRSLNQWTQQQIAALAQLIATTCQTDAFRDVLVKTGILDSLAERLASTIVSIGYLLPNSDRGVVATLPSPLPKYMLPHLIDAISAIIEGSKYRQARFIFSPDLVGIFPYNTDTMMMVDSENQFPQATISVDRLLPQIQAVQSRGESSFSKSFPPLGPFSSMEYPRMAMGGEVPQQPSTRVITGEEFETPLYAWLVHMTRAEEGMERLRFARLLMQITQSLRAESPRTTLTETVNKNRDRVLAFLIVPLLVKMIDETALALKDKRLSSSPKEFQEKRQILQEAPVVLASLIGESVPLQNATVDAGAIPVLCQILKRSFDPLPPPQGKAWTPYKDWPTKPQEVVTPNLLHALKCRAGTLQALAAIAYREDKYRKSIIEQGAVHCICDSLFPRHTDKKDTNQEADATTPNVLDNPPAVLVAACQSARSMSRSVSVLRTSLIDAKISAPISLCLRHENVEVQIAATDVLCNLLLQFSPLKEVSGPCLMQVWI
jgi:armadillo repeat-containing protein 8